MTGYMVMFHFFSLGGTQHETPGEKKSSPVPIKSFQKPLADSFVIIPDTEDVKMPFGDPENSELQQNTSTGI